MIIKPRNSSDDEYQRGLYIDRRPEINVNDLCLFIRQRMVYYNRPSGIYTRHYFNENSPSNRTKHSVYIHSLCVHICGSQLKIHLLKTLGDQNLLIVPICFYDLLRGSCRTPIKQKQLCYLPGMATDQYGSCRSDILYVLLCRVRIYICGWKVSCACEYLKSSFRMLFQ